MRKQTAFFAFTFLAFSAPLAGKLRAQTSLPDASQLLQQQDAQLGAQPGTVTLSQPARLGTTVTLGAGHALHIAAPLTVGNASIRLTGHNTVHCDAPVTVENATDLFVADGATDLSVTGCTVKNIGRGGGYLLTATRGARVIATGNHLTDVALFTTHNSGVPGSQTTDVTLSNNSVDFPAGGGPIGVYLMYVVGGTVSSNQFHGTGHGVEWWGGDANAGWPGFDKVTGAGKLTITGNQCNNAGGSCVWGSDGFDITVTGNTAELCGDVCFDTEGGVRNTFSKNTARACANGCYSAQFESQNVVFSNNSAYADNKAKALALVLIKHPSGRGPNHENLSITGNTFTCGDACTAYYSEGEDGMTFSNNTVTNGNIAFTNFDNNIEIQNNTFRYTVPLGAAAVIGGPALANGHHSEVIGNTISTTVPPDPKAMCIAQGWVDYNSSDEMRFINNTCSGFPTGILTLTAGGNPGAPHAIWFLQGNQFLNVPPAQQIVHQHRSGNEVYESVPAGHSH